MSYIKASQRYNFAAVPKHPSANKDVKMHRSHAAEPVNRAFQTSRGYHDLSEHPLFVRPHSQQYGGHQSTYGEGWRPPTPAYGGLYGADYPSAVRSAPLQTRDASRSDHERLAHSRQATYQPAIRTTVSQEGQDFSRFEYGRQQHQQYDPFYFQHESYLWPAQYQSYAPPAWLGFSPIQPQLTHQWYVDDEVSPPTQSLNVKARPFEPGNSKKNQYSAFHNAHGQPNLADSESYQRWPPKSHGSVPNITSPRRSTRIANHVPAQHYGSYAQYLGGPAPFDTGMRSFPVSKQNDTKYIMPRPQPSEAYLQQASQAPVSLGQGRPLLVVLDLNGTLMHRDKSRSNATHRPRVKEFLHYLFREHHVMIWSSMRPENVEKHCKAILSEAQRDQLVACWDRKMLRIPSHAYNQKVQTYKQLSWIWKDKQIQSANPKPIEYWSQDNTVLIDDSSEKAASEPYNIIELEEFEGRKDQAETDVLGSVAKYLGTLRWEKDVSAYIRSNAFASMAKEPFDWMPIENDMHQGQSAC